MLHHLISVSRPYRVEKARREGLKQTSGGDFQRRRPARQISVQGTCTICLVDMESSPIPFIIPTTSRATTRRMWALTRCWSCVRSRFRKSVSRLLYAADRATSLVTGGSAYRTASMPHIVHQMQTDRCRIFGESTSWPIRLVLHRAVGDPNYGVVGFPTTKCIAAAQHTNIR